MGLSRNIRKKFRRGPFAQEDDEQRLPLEDGARIAVVGGGPAGSMFSYFALKMAGILGLELEVVIYEPRYFTHRGAAGCNHCGGIISESLVQFLAIEGINLPGNVVQRGIDSYMLHMDVGKVRIETPGQEKKIAAVYRGNGPAESEILDFSGFDRYLQECAEGRGARIERKLVNGIEWDSGRPRLRFPGGSGETYDLAVVATGVNSRLIESVSGFNHKKRAPQTVKSFIAEFRLGRDAIRRHLGTSMHVFLLDLPRLEFAAIIPKGDFATLALLGHDIDQELINSFLDSPAVRECFPDMEVPERACHCFPRLNVRPAVRPYGDRIVFIGDSGVARLYKDGIGSAYRTAKAAALTAVFHGVSEEDFRQYYWPACRTISFDNFLGKLIFAASHFFQRRRFWRRAMLRMTTIEQATQGKPQRLSSVCWDLFTGSAPYRDVLKRTLHPKFILGIFWNLPAANWPGRKGRKAAEQPLPDES